MMRGKKEGRSLLMYFCNKNVRIAFKKELVNPNITVVGSKLGHS